MFASQCTDLNTLIEQSICAKYCILSDQNISHFMKVRSRYSNRAVTYSNTLMQQLGNSNIL